MTLFDKPDSIIPNSKSAITNYSLNSRLDDEKPLLIILEGGDKVGKSSIYQLLRRATQYGPLVIDRFTGSNMVYDTVYLRGRNPDMLLKKESELTTIFNVVLFVLVADTETQEQRISLGEFGLNKRIALDNFKQVNTAFMKYIDISEYKFKYVIDTSSLGERATVRAILEQLEAIGYER